MAVERLMITRSNPKCFKNSKSVSTKNLSTKILLSARVCANLAIPSAIVCVKLSSAIIIPYSIPYVHLHSPLSVRFISTKMALNVTLSNAACRLENWVGSTQCQI